MFSISMGNRFSQNGMTLIELVTVILVIGILSVIAVPRFFSSTAFDASGFFQISLANVRYAQKLALTSGCDIRVSIDATGVQLNQWNDGTACTAGVSAPMIVTRPGSSDAIAETPPDGVTITGSVLIYFDAIGRPHDAGSGILLTVPSNVVIGGRTLTIENETGYIRCTAGCS
jgi:MSHA pilin protein MshC